MTPTNKLNQTPHVWIADRERYEANRYSKILAEFSPVVVYLEPSMTLLEENAA
jgi:hypothetical protein